MIWKVIYLGHGLVQGLARQKSNIHRAQSVDLSARSPLAASQAEAAFNLEESFRRAEAARAMSMDASRVPGIDSWPVDAILSGRKFALKPPSSLSGAFSQFHF